jgi:hypothetical protein
MKNLCFLILKIKSECHHLDMEIKLTALKYSRYICSCLMWQYIKSQWPWNFLWVTQCMHMEFHFKSIYLRKYHARSSSSIKAIVSGNESINFVEIFLKCRLIKISSIASDMKSITLMMVSMIYRILTIFFSIKSSGVLRDAVPCLSIIAKSC